jgi:hypothetical protein
MIEQQSCDRVLRVVCGRLHCEVRSTAFLYAVLLDDRRARASALAQGEESVGCWDHRCGPLVDGVNDLGVVDAA